MKTTSSLLVVLAALLLNAATISQSLSQLPLKPVRSHGLPIDPLENIQPKSIDDCDEELQRPGKRDLNEKKLHRRLGGRIDDRFLSITEPVQSSEKFVKRISLRAITTSEKNFLRQVINNETQVLKMGKPSALMERFMMKWLIHKSDCPVEYTWKDLGSCYWPRWISMGRCENKQCSWPHGLSCAPSDLVPVYLLRWHCKSRGGKKAKRGTDSARISCRWLKFSYPIIHQCKCQCSEKPDTQGDASTELLTHNLLQGNE